MKDDDDGAAFLFLVEKEVLQGRKIIKVIVELDDDGIDAAIGRWL